MNMGVTCRSPLWLLLLVVAHGVALSAPRGLTTSGIRRSALGRRSSARALMPLGDVDSKLFEPEKGLTFGGVVRGDVFAAGTLLVESFYPEIIALDDTFSPRERRLLDPAVAWINSSIAAYLHGSIVNALAARLGERTLLAATPDVFIDPPLVTAPVGSRSIALGAADASTGELLGFVELTVRPRDGQVPSDALDGMEDAMRTVAQPKHPPCAYLCNLCVSPRARRRGIGSTLVHVCERVALEHWGFSELYLHVRRTDDATTRLYESLGFSVLPEYDPKQWQVRWLGAPDTRYFCKQLSDAAATSFAAA